MGKFGEYLGLLLKQKRFTKAELARRLKLKKQGYIGNVIAGIHTPTLERIYQIAKILECNEKEKRQLVNLAIDERHTKKLYRIKPLYPDLRNILLAHYEETNNSLSRKEIVKKLELSPFHPIENSILQKVYTYLRTLEMAPPFEDAISYFRKLNLEGKKIKLEQARFKWSYSSNHDTIKYLHTLGPGGSANIDFIYPAPMELSPKFQLIRNELIENLYSKNPHKFEKSHSPYGIPIIKQINSVPYHPIEDKILFEVYMLLREEHKTTATNLDAFLLIIRHNALAKLKETLAYWHFDEKKDILTLALKLKDKKEIIIKKFALWQEVIKL
jgi:transcriptional regulator with XRE-family HTH domain